MKPAEGIRGRLHLLLEQRNSSLVLPLDQESLGCLARAGHGILPVPREHLAARLAQDTQPVAVLDFRVHVFRANAPDTTSIVPSPELDGRSQLGWHEVGVLDHLS